METLQTDNIAPEHLDELEQFAHNNVDPALRELLLTLSRCVRSGDTVVAFGDDQAFTPSQVAERLGMSRTHLYKLLDRGEIASHRVGRDRRIRLQDLIAFEAEHQRDRRELAERFARQRQTAAEVDSELAELL